MPEYLLGIDFGTKRIGLAIASTLTNQANPLTTIQNNQSLWIELEKIVSEWCIKHAIIGLPLDQEGEEQEITRQVRNFGKKIINRLNIDIEYIDERYSSYEAERLFQKRRENNLSKAKHKKDIDAMAAQVILQSWLNQNTTS